MAKPSLNSKGWFNVRRVTVEEDCLGFCEQQFGSDRVRRVLFDRISSVVVWRRFPWDRAVVYFMIFGAPGMLLYAAGLSQSQPAVWMIGSLLLALSSLILVQYLWYRRSIILVNRDGKSRRFQVIASPRRVSTFLKALDEGISGYQASHRQADEASAVASAPLAEPPLVQTPASNG